MTPGGNVASVALAGSVAHFSSPLPCTLIVKDFVLSDKSCDTSVLAVGTGTRYILLVVAASSVALPRIVPVMLLKLVPLS